MSYLNDPREMAIRPESGVTLEEDNRYEEMWHWGAAVLDLCNLPVEEYMKPMTINVEGGGSGGGESSSTTKTYTLRFYLDGSQKTSYKLEEGAPIPNVNAEKDGYDFSGWADASGNTYTTMPAANLTLYGTNTIKKFTVKFIIDGEEATEYEQIVNWGNKVQNIPSSAKTGYEFSGWEPQIPSTIKSNFTFVGSFTKKSYTVAFKVSGETQTAVFEYGENIVYPAVDSKPGYTICGWTPSNITEMPDNEHLTLTAVLSANEHTVKYLISHDSDLDDIIVSEYKVRFGQTIPSESVPSESGYSFTNWSADTQIVANRMPDSDVNFYSKKSVNEYTLKYVVDGYDSMFPMETIPYGAKVSVKEKFVKEGYTVTDWSFVPALNEIPDEMGGGYSMPYFDVVASCETSINSYNVVLKHGDEIVFSGSVEYGTEISTLVPEGYTYSGTPANVPSEDIEKEVSINTYNVTIVVDGKDTVVLPMEYNSDITPAVEDYINNNYPMGGYHIESNIPDGAKVPAHDVQYEVNTVPNKHNVTISQTSGTKVITLNYGENILDAIDGQVDVDEFHYLDGWLINGQPLSADATMPDEDIVVEPVIKVKESSVTPIISGETESSATTYDYGTPISEVIENIIASASEQTKEDIVDPGYAVEWTVNGSAYTEDMVVKEDEVTVEVTITPKPFKLSFMRRATAAFSADVVESGETLYKEQIVYPALPASIEISGVTYEFKWDEDSIEEGTPMPSNEVVVYGEYVEKPVAKTIYKGLLSHSDIISLTDDDEKVLAMETYPDFPSDGKIELSLPGNWEEYNDHYNNDTDEEFEAFLLSIARQPVMVMPSSINLFDYTAKRGIETIRTITKSHEIKIDGADYTVWYENKIDNEYFETPGYFVSDNQPTWNLSITFTK